MVRVHLQQPPIDRSFALAMCVLLMAVWADAVPAHAEPQSAISSEIITLPNLRQPVEILIDHWGVPHIYAKNEADLFFAQGFNAARDRLFQIDLWRRRGLGQLSEVFGPGFVEQDKATRLFLYRGDMDKEWAAYGPDAKQIAEPFVAGVNMYIDWLAHHPEQVPWEFKELNYAPAKWSTDDVVRIRSHGLTRNLQSEVARSKVMCAADLKSDEVRRGLQPPWQPQVPPGFDPCLPKDLLNVFTLATQEVRLTSAALKAMVTTDSAPTVEIADGEQTTENFEGSNNWVIAPSKSATGRAILANDPHRAYSEPSLRYISDLNAPTRHVIGQ
jgi:penicillin amidase